MPLLAGCAGGGSSSTSTSSGGSNPPTPTALAITAVAPTNVPVGSGDVALTVNGTGFTSGSVVSVNNVAEATSYVNATQLKATVPANQLAVGAVLSVSVKSEVGAVTADPSTTALSVDNPVPSLASIAPATIALGAPDTTVTVTGTNFVPGVALAVNGTTRTSTFVSATQLTAKLLAADFTAAGPLPLNVINPKPGGGTSGTSSLAVSNPAPAITSVSPATVPTGGSTPVTVTITGTGFLPATAVQINGAARAATVVSGTQITFSLTAADMASTGTLSITLVNPAPGGGTSNVSTVQVGVPAPTITSLSPATLPVGSAATTVTITGTGFVPASTVQFGAVTHAGVSFVSSTQLTLPLTAADLTYSGNYPVTVTNPAASGGASKPASFVVQAATPVLATITPSTLAINSGSFSITATGTNFASSSKLNWNGSPIPTTYTYTYSATPTNPYAYTYVLVGTVSTDLLASTGTASVTVTTPTAAAASNALTVTVGNPPVPSVSSLSPNAVPTNADAKLSITGTGFAKSSVVSYNGQPLTTTFNSNTSLSVTVPAASLTVPGNNAVTVSTPAPGGGTSTGVPLTVYVPLVSNSMVFNPVNGLAYLSIPSTGSTITGNSIVSFDPATGALGTPIFVGSEPGVMAISDDGTTLWVALNGTTAIRKVDLVHATAGAQYSISAMAGYYNTVTALLVLPGTTDSVAVTNSSLLGIYDAGVLRGSTISTNSAYALQADGTRKEIYAGGYTVQAYTYSNTGITLKSSGTNSFPYSVASSGLDDIQLTGGKLFTDYGRVYDPESGGQLGTFNQGTTVLQGPTLNDPGLSQVYVLNSSQNPGYYYNGYSQVSLFSPTDYSSTGKSFAWNIPSSLQTGSGSNQTYYNLQPHRLTRWGSNGLLLHTQAAIFSAQSNVIKDQSSVSADLSITLSASGGTTTGSTASYTATVKNAGPQAATDVAVSLQAPTTGVLTGATSTVGACSSVNGCTLGTIASGSTATIAIQVLQTTAGSGSLNAQVQSSSTDPVSSNNVASSSIAVTGTTYNLVPTLITVTPNAVKAGSTDTTITATGANFASGSQIVLGSTALTTTFVSSSTLTATVPTASLTTMTWAPVSISTPAPGGGTSNSLPFTVFNVVTVGLNHIVYEPYSRKLYASVSSGSTNVTGNSIVSIDPATGTFGTPVTFNTAPNLLALSNSGQTLYTNLALPSSSNYTFISSLPMGRVDLLSGTGASVTANLSTSTYSYNSTLNSMAVQPGSENTLAVGLQYGYADLLDYSASGNTLTQRGAPASNSYSASPCLYFLDASDLLTLGYNTYLYPVTATGFGTGKLLPSTTACFQLNGTTGADTSGKLYNVTTSGVTQTGTVVLSNAYSYSTGQAAPDTSLGSVFYPANTSSSSYGYADGLFSYDLHSFLRTGSLFLNIPTIEGSNYYSTGVGDIVRWGQDGLAMITSTGHLYLLRGPFVVPQEMVSSTAATLTSSSTTSITVGSKNTLLTLTGSNFQPGVAVTWNGSYRTTTIVDATHVSVAIPASDLAAASTGNLVATNPGATASNTLTVTVR
ncbi:beta strand repeat-containing protein [Terriglobus aquaticus]|uniref:Beta strand repeat-containing protein n=1 Tax=Terriglobus aquaticus TaxID=940139 RepID=A0ABW9KS36_9BACT|nr:IPT/TIG domain-containing protein [Terriglobus aquaticus]